MSRCPPAGLPGRPDTSPLPSGQHELVCVSAATPDALAAALRGLHDAAATVSVRDLAERAARSRQTDRAHLPARAAIVAAHPAELRARLDEALRAVGSGMALRPGSAAAWVGMAGRAPRIALLFPGDAAPVRMSANAWTARFPELLGDLAEDLPKHLPDAAGLGVAAAQPAITAASLAGLALLARAGLGAETAVGHSLGEIAALHWAGVLSRYQCRKLAAIRGRVIARHAAPGGAMARVAAAAAAVVEPAHAHFLEIGCDDAPGQCVVSGPAGQVDAFVLAMAAEGIRAVRLAVPLAFHSQMMAPAQLPFASELRMFAASTPGRRMVSTVTGAVLRDDAPLDLLTEQLVSPVRFRQALSVAAAGCDVFVEVGAGSGLCGLAEACGHRALPLDALADSLDSLLATLGQLFVMGATPDPALLFAGRGGGAPAAPPALAEAVRIDGAGPWIRVFERRWVACEPDRVIAAGTPGPRWAPLGGGSFEPWLAEAAGPAKDADGALILARRDLRFVTAQALWTAVRAAHGRGLRHLAILHEGLLLEGFAASLLADGAFASVRLIDVPSLAEPPPGATLLLRGAASEALLALRAEPDGRVTRPVLSVVDPPQRPDALALGESDQILVTGGAADIGAACALRLGERTGARLLLAGRRPGRDPAVQDVLRRARERGVRAAYVPVDVSDCHRATVTLAECELKLGKITAVVHAAGVNRPAPFGDIPDAELEVAFLPKLEGLETILAAIDHSNVRFLASFGSLTAHTGLAGEAHYALANAFAAMRLVEWGAEPAHRGRPPRFLNLDWSAWDGQGMAGRFADLGVDRLPLEAGLRLFEALCCDTDACGSYVVAGRFGAETLPGAPPLASPPRVVERVLLHTPGVELVADCVLKPGSAPLVADRPPSARQAELMLLDAMAQVAATLDDAPGSPALREVALGSALRCPPGGDTRFRVAALREPDGRIRLAARSPADGFATVVARATRDPAPPADRTARPGPGRTGAGGTDAG
jgi:malonyl CoA-acyl carrier protein transacylase